MKARVLFGVFGFAFVLLALYVFPPIVLELVVAALCVFATYEVLGSTKLVRNHLELLLAMAVSLGLAVGHFSILPLRLESIMQGLVLVLLFGSFAIELKYHDVMKASQVSWAFFGGLAVPYLLLSLLRIFQMHYHHGSFIVLLPLLAAWGADTCALFSGMLFGKHKLAPVVSPKKTVEGAVGGVVGAEVVLFTVDKLRNVYLADVEQGAAQRRGVLADVYGGQGRHAEFSRGQSGVVPVQWLQCLLRLRL